MTLHPLAKDLRSKLEQTGRLPSDTFDLFYQLLGSPGDLRGLVYVVINLRIIIPEARSIPNGSASKKDLDLLEEAATKILDGKDLDSPDVKFFFSNKFRKMGIRNFDGLMKNACVFAALGAGPKYKYEWPKFKNLLAHLLDCHLQQEDEKRDIGESTTVDACLAIRELSYQENIETLRQLPDEELSTENYLLRLDNISPLPGKIKSYPQLLRYFRRALGTRKPPEPTRKPSNETPGNLPPRQRKKYNRQAGHSEDFKKPTSSLRGTIRTNARTSLREQQRSRQKARGRRNAIARKNNHLSYDKTELSLNDFAILMDALNSDTITDFMSKDQWLEASALLSAMLWTGKTVKEMLSFRLWLGPEDEAEQGVPALLWRDTECAWSIPSPGPNIKQPTPSQAGLFFPTGSTINLPVLNSTRKILEKHISQLGTTIRKRSLLFSSNYETLRNNAQKLLSYLKEQFDCEASLINISTFLAKQLTRSAGGEMAKTALTLGAIQQKVEDDGNLQDEEIPTSEDEWRSSVKEHYQSSPEKELRHNYFVLTSRLEALWLGEKSARKTTDPMSGTATGLNLGTPIRPRQECIRSLITQLKRKINHSPPSDLDDPIAIVDFHLAYTFYTSLMNNVSSLLRAIRSPAISSELTDTLTGFAAISDKDDNDNYNCRRIWLPPVVREQNQLFAKHMNILYNLLHHLSSSLPVRFSQSPPGTGKEYILLGHDLNTAFMTPNDLRNYLKSYFFFDGVAVDLPGNWQRHYMRPLLLEDDCPTETLNALMGHFETGQEPWARTSAFHPADYHATLASHLVKLMESDGWEALPGLGKTQ
ncbi:MAG: hypothetical protein ACYDAI_14750 [Trichloromonadaceae bacterium]